MYPPSILSVQFTAAKYPVSGCGWLPEPRIPVAQCCCFWHCCPHRDHWPSLLLGFWDASVSWSELALSSALYYLYLLPLVFSTLLALWNVPIPQHGKSYSFLRCVRWLLPLAPCSKSCLCSVRTSHYRMTALTIYYNTLFMCLSQHWNVSFLRRKILACSFLFL